MSRPCTQRIGTLVGLAVILAGGAVGAAPMTLDECVRLALERSPSTQGADADLAAADARVRAARAAYWPKLSAQAQYGHSAGYDTAITNGGVTALGVAIDAPMLDGGRRDAELAAARARLQSATALAQQRRADVAGVVRNAYCTALTARSEMATQADAARTLTDYLALLQRQEGLGLVAASDPPLAELAVETARTAERAAAALLETATRELAELTGAALDSTSLVELEGLPLAPATDERIEASPVMVDARAAAAAAARDADAVRSEGRGHLALTADGGFLGVDPSPTFRNNGGGEFLLGFSVPLFDGGAVAARVAAASAATASAEAKVGQVRETLVIELARVRADAQRAQADAAAWRRVLPAAAEAFLLMRARYFGGAGVRLLDVLDALNQSVAAHLAIPRALLAYRLAAANQAQLLGRIEP